MHPSSTRQHSLLGHAANASRTRQGGGSTVNDCDDGYAVDPDIRYDRMVLLAPEPVLLCREGHILLANSKAARALGVQMPESLFGRPILDFIDPAFHAAFDECSAAASACRIHEQVWMRANGSPLAVEIVLSDLAFDGLPALQIALRDVSARKRSEGLQLAQSNVLKLIATGVELHEILSEIARIAEQYSDQALCSILLPDESGRRLGIGTAPSMHAARLRRLEQRTAGARNGSDWSASHRNEPAKATDIATDPVWENKPVALECAQRACTSWPILASDKKILGSFVLHFKQPIATGADDLDLVTVCTKLAGIAIERHAAEERVRRLAHYDGLTGLPNRFLFEEYLDLAVRCAPRRRQDFAVLFLDLDRFKEVNDKLGHDAGDLVLREIATRLRNCLRGSDKIARQGGDEFYILIEDLADARHASEVARKLVAAAAQPVLVNGQSCTLGASIGVAIYPLDGTDGKTLLKRADAAMYRAKESGRNTYFFHTHQSEAMNAA